jgi:hypothetical protein
MIRNAMIALLSFCCIFVFGQVQIQFSKTFETKKKNVPVAILNNHSGYFHVLRYNKTVHDFTLERRSKPNCTILAFTPLRLDSVNVSWFDYEKLDYLFFEEDHKTYFLFEKILNTKRTLYLKIIDTLGKSTGFIALSTLEAEPGVGLKFTFSREVDQKLLVVGAMSYANGVTKKSAVLFDLKTLKSIWIKKLPHENSTTEITDRFTINQENDLFYMHSKINSQFLVRRGDHDERIINEYGPISVFKSFSNSKEMLSKELNIKNIEAVYSSTLIAQENNVIFAGHLVEEELGKRTYLYLEKLNDSLDKILYKYKHDFSKEINEQLSFYDGTNYKEPAYKNYLLKNVFVNENSLLYVSERKEENYYKELLSWKLDIEKGTLAGMSVIPRKIFYFDDRTRFKKLGEAMISFKNGALNTYVIEHPRNLSTTNTAFRFHDFEKQTNVWGGNLINYSIKEDHVNKKLIYSNRNFDLVPLLYQSSDVNNEVFYFNEGKYEKFGFISLLNP